MEKLISIVIPIYNEEKNIPILYVELKKVLDSINFDWEMVLVNDGSKDGSIMELEKLSQLDSKVKVLDFSRNFGKEAATTAGCCFAKGDAVVTMDADLQHPPIVINEFLKKWQEEFEVVYTVRKENKGASFIKKTTSRIYWWIFSKISSSNSEPHSTDFRLLDRKVVDEFKKFPERGRIFRGIIDWMGYKRVRVDFVAPERAAGEAGYSYSKLFGLAINSLTAFSLMPLKLAGYLGVIITFFSSIFFVIMLITRWFFSPVMFSSVAFLMIINILLIGIVLICLGFIALYIARIHDEVVDRPLYIVRNKINID